MFPNNKPNICHGKQNVRATALADLKKKKNNLFLNIYSSPSSTLYCSIISSLEFIMDHIHCE